MKEAADAEHAVSVTARLLWLAQHDLDRLVRLMDLGWMRHLPPTVALVLEGIGDLPRVVVEEMIEHESCTDLWGQEGPGEEVLDTDEDLQIAATLHPEVTDPAELARLSAQDRAGAAAHLRARQDEFSRVCSALGIAEPKTAGEIYPFLLALGVIEEYQRGGTVWIRDLATDLDPIDVLRLDEQTAAEERAMRGEMRFMRIAAEVANQFQAAGGRDGRVATSLGRLARLTRLSVDQLRLCLTGGVDAGILICNRDLNALEEHRKFELRISVGGGDAVQAFTTEYRLAA